MDTIRWRLGAVSAVNAVSVVNDESVVLLLPGMLLLGLEEPVGVGAIQV